MAFSTTNGQEASTLQVTVPSDAAAIAPYVTGKFWSYDAIFDLPISGYAKLAYLNLCRRAGKNGTAYVSQEKIARDCGMSRRSVQRALIELVPVGAVQVRSRKAQGLNNLYCPTPPNLWQGGCVSVAQGCVSVAHKGSPCGKTREDSLSSQENSLPTPALPLPQEAPPPSVPLAAPAPSVSAAETPFPPVLLPTVKESVKTFYQNIGQPQVSSQKLKAGLKTIADLKTQGFPLTDILWVMMWITNHPQQFKTPVYSLGLLPHVISQALQEKHRVGEREARKQRLGTEEQKQEAEIRRRQELEQLYQTLSPTEQAHLRSIAVEGLLEKGIQQRFLLESLVKSEICRLLGEGHHKVNSMSSMSMTT